MKDKTGESYTCADGTPYKFFVQFNTNATNLTVTFDHGGACWDYNTCTGQTGNLTPATLGRIPDNLMTNQELTGFNTFPRGLLYPHLGRVNNSVPTNKYNHVFFPYCTADTYLGNTEKTYRDANSTASITLKHHGYRNIRAATRWLTENFSSKRTGQLLAIGTSAGGTGVTFNYPMIREAVSPKCGAMVNDAGLVLLPGGPQQPMIDKLFATWNLGASGSIAEDLDRVLFNNIGYNIFIRDNPANIIDGLSRRFPDDRFLYSAFREDLIFSLFSFAGSGAVTSSPTMARNLMSNWDSELDYFKQYADHLRVYSTKKKAFARNFGYFFPEFRYDICSHGTAIVPIGQIYDYQSEVLMGYFNGYLGTELGPEFTTTASSGETVTRQLDFGDALRQLLDVSKPIPSYVGSIGDVPTHDYTFLYAGTYTGTTPLWRDYLNNYATLRNAQKPAWLAKMTDPTNTSSCVYTGNYKPN